MRSATEEFHERISTNGCLNDNNLSNQVGISEDGRENDDTAQDVDVANQKIKKEGTVDLAKQIVEKIPTFRTDLAFVGDDATKMAAYALTLTIAKHAKAISHSIDVSGPPSVLIVDTNVKEKTNIFVNVMGTMPDGTIISAILDTNVHPTVYHVSIMSDNDDSLQKWQYIINQATEMSNFYQGKFLKIGANRIDFEEPPVKDIDDIIIDESIKKVFLRNTVDFMLDKERHAITTRRGVLLFGPPGGGKTSLVSYVIKCMTDNGITVVMINDDTLRRNDVEALFKFINDYLAPATVILEDIDLVGEDRNTSQSTGVIGQLLGVLNGPTRGKKPLLTLATTNRVDVLDSAIVRPCRFDRKLSIALPDKKKIKTMFIKRGLTITDKEAKKLEDEEVTGSHVEEISLTVKLLMASNGDKDAQNYLDEAIEEVVDNYFIDPVVGFNVKKDKKDGVCSDDDDSECPPICHEDPCEC